MMVKITYLMVNADDMMVNGQDVIMNADVLYALSPLPSPQNKKAVH